jgi:hydrogenase maturation protease
MKRIAVIGVGNELLSDEGLVVHAARILAGESWPEGVTVTEAGTVGFGLMPLLGGQDAVLFLDVILADAPSGSIFCYSPDQAPDGRRGGFSLHQFGVLEALQTARLIGIAPEVAILAMVPADIETPSIELSPWVRERLDAFLDLARQKIRELLSG